MSPRTIFMALAAALSGCGVIEDDRPTIARAAAPAAQGMVIEDVPAFRPAPSIVVPSRRASTEWSAMGYGSTYGSTYSGASLGRTGAAYKDAGVVVFYGFGGTYSSSVLYSSAYGYPYGAFAYRHPSLFGYGKKRGFARTSIRPRDPTKHDKVGRLPGRRFERALHDESRSLRKQLKRANQGAIVILSMPTHVKKVKRPRAIVFEPQRMKAKRGIIGSPRVKTKFLSQWPAVGLPRFHAPMRWRSEGDFRQAVGGKRKARRW